MNYLFINNNLVLEEDYFKFSNSLLDEFEHGNGLFETILYSPKSEIILWNEHIERLRNSAKEFNKIIDYDFDILKEKIKEKITDSNLHKVKLIYTFYGSKLFVKIEKYKFSEENLTLYSDLGNRRENNRFYSYKMLSYAENLFFKAIAEKLNYNDYLFIDKLGNILETTNANIYFVNKDGVLETPIYKKNFLNGVMRGFLLNNQKKIGIKIIEKDININEIGNYDEVILTNSLKLSINVHKINNVYFRNEDKNKIINDFLRRELCHYQVLR